MGKEQTFLPFDDSGVCAVGSLVCSSLSGSEESDCWLADSADASVVLSTTSTVTESSIKEQTHLKYVFFFFKEHVCCLNVDSTSHMNGHRDAFSTLPSPATQPPGN